jgi:hypothetical protein
MTTPEAPSPSAAPATPMNAAEIRLAETSPIDAIKAYRNRTGCTLKQAKDAFDAAPSPSPGATRDPVSCSTCTQVNLGLCPIVSGAPDAACPDAAPSPGATTPLTADLDALERLMAAAWPAPWRAHTFEIDCPCPNGEHCGDSHSCEEVEAPEAYPASPEEPADEGDGQCVVQISVPGLESLARPTAEFIAAARNDLPAILAELRSLRRLRADEEGRDTAEVLEVFAAGVPRILSCGHHHDSQRVVLSRECVCGDSERGQDVTAGLWLLEKARAPLPDWRDATRGLNGSTEEG